MQKEDPAVVQKKREDLWNSIVTKFEPGKSAAYTMIDVPNFKQKAEKMYFDFIVQEQFCEFIPTREVFKHITQVKTMQQNYHKLSGFHSIWTTKCLVSSMLASSKEDAALSLLKNTCNSEF